jgi:phosphoribosylamine--glycine ligase
VLQAGTAIDAYGNVIAVGGRVLSVVGTGATLADARRAAYARVARIGLTGSQHRTDIAEAAAADGTSGRA